MSKEEFGIFDIIKIIAACLVVAIHVGPLTDFHGNFYIVTFARIAVPMFFCMSGFLFFRKNNSLPSDEQKNALFGYIRRILLLFLFWFILGLPIYLYQAFIVNQLSPLEFLRNLVLSPAYNVLWYLIASIYGTLIIWTAYKWLNIRTVLFVGIVAHLLCVMSGQLRGICPQVLEHFFSDYELVVLAPVECSFPSSLAFIALGCWFAEPKRQTTLSRQGMLQNIFYGGILTASVFFLFVESRLCTVVYKISNTPIVYFSLLPIVLCMMFLLLRTKMPSTATLKLLRNTSVVVYLSHPLFVFMLRKFCPIELNSLVFYVLVLSFSFTLALLIFKLKKFRHLEWLRYSH